jgi:putative PEP-CTERM system histidine kinase
MLLGLVSTLITLAGSVLGIGLGGHVLYRNPRQQANRWLAAALAAIAVHQGFLLGLLLPIGGVWRIVVYRIAIAVLAVVPAIWLGFGLRFAVLKNGGSKSYWRFAPPGLLAAAVVSWTGLATGHVVEPVRIPGMSGLLFALDTWGRLHFSLFLVALVLVLVHFENLYRHAEGGTRRQIRLLVVGAFVSFGSQIVTTSYILLYGFVHPSYWLYSALGFLAGQALVAFAVIRHRLLDVNFYVSRQVFYRSVTLGLVGGYLFFLALLTECFHRLGTTLDLLTGTLIASLGGAALALLLLSEDVRWRAKIFIQTHFYRHKYDYRAEWMEFTHSMAHATTETTVATQTIKRILEVMWVDEAAIYAGNGMGCRVGLVVREGFGDLAESLEMPPDGMPDRRVTSQQASKSAIVATGDSTTLRQGWLSNPRIGSVTPLAALDTFVGLLIIGRERSGKPFTADDRLLIEAIAAQAASSMLNARLMLEAAEGRDLQVFAQLAAFLTHDLKNMVTILSGLTDSAKRYMSDPDFQTDAIRSIGEVTGKMRTLLAALTSPGTNGHLKVETIPFSATIKRSVDELRKQLPSRIHLETRLDTLAHVRADPEQLQSVLRNLVLNAVDAIPECGTILIETGEVDRYAVLAVNDNGKGMSREFIERRLFRPLQTTKASGLGIGLYQCRHIIQSYGGTLAAESEEGEGTRMTVKLPMAERAQSRHEAIGGERDV